MGYIPQTIKGVGWTGALRIGMRAITFIRIIILARFFLNPHQFGVFGIASLFVAFFDVSTETGVQIFLIQEKSKLNEYVNAAWIVSIVRGIIFAGVIILIAPFVSSFYQSKEVFLLLLLFSLFPFIEGFINPTEIVLQKDLLFHKEFYYRFFLYCIESATVILVAALTKSAIAFVVGILVSTLIEVILSFLFFSPKPSFIIELSKIRHIIHRGKWVSLFGIFGYLAQEGDNFVVGKVLGASSLAIYQTGYKFSTLPVSEITDVVSKVVFPVYARFHDDIPRLKRAFFLTTGIILAGATFLGLIIIIFGKLIIFYTLGDKWTAITTILPILTVYGMLRAIFGSASSTFLAVGKQKYIAAMTFVRFIGLALTIIPLTMAFGLVGASFSALFSVLIEIPLIIYFLYNLFNKKK